MRFVCAFVALIAVPVLAQEKKVVVDAPPKLFAAIKAGLPKRVVAVATKPLPSQPLSKDVNDACDKAGAAIAVVKATVIGTTYTLEVYNGADGALLETQTFTGPAVARFKQVPKDVLASIVFALSTAQPPLPPPPPPPAEPEASAEPAPEPAKTEPAKTEPAKAEPAKTEPAAAEPAKTETAAAEPAKAEPGTSEPPPPEPKPEPAKAEPPPVKKAEAAPAPRPAAPPAVKAPTGPAQANGWPAVLASVGFRGLSRSFNYSGNPSSNLSTLSMGLAPAVAVDAAWFPGAHFTSGALAHLGMFLQADFVFGLAARQDQARFGAHAERYRGGAQVRFPIARAFELDLHAGYLSHGFNIDATSATGNTPRPNIAGVTYAGPRGGLGMKINPTDKFSIELHGAFTFVAFKGELGSEKFFPNATGFGFDVAGALAYLIAPNLQLRASVDYASYLLTLNPAVGATFQAENANDSYFGGTLALAWVM